MGDIKPAAGQPSACVWDLEFPRYDHHKEAMELGGYDKGLENYIEKMKKANETVLGDQKAEDRRQLVDETKRKKDYSAIVKITMRFVNQSPKSDAWGQGTGWLIKPDVVVTAGHCVYDHYSNKGQPFGRAVLVRVWSDYNGKESSQAANFRSGIRVATTAAYVADGENHQNDVAVIQLDRPYYDIKPFDTYDVAKKDTKELVLAGYPSDQSYRGETGARMYEDGRQITWDLESTKDPGMLHYDIDSFKGQSGSPVMIRNTRTVVGVHVYGSNPKRDMRLNSASVFGGTGKFGNDVSKLAQVLGVPEFSLLSTKKPEAFIDYIDLEGTSLTENALAQGQEGFLDVFKQVAGFGSAAISTAAPFLGPVYGTVAAAAGAGLGLAGKLASHYESGFAGTSIESTLDTKEGPQDYIARAVVAEAYLSTILNTPEPTKTLEANQMVRLKAIMQREYMFLKRRTLRFGPHLTSVIGDAVTRSILDSSPTTSPAQGSNEASVSESPESILLSTDLESNVKAVYESMFDKPGTEASEASWADAATVIAKAYRLGRRNLPTIGRALVALDKYLNDERKDRDAAKPSSKPAPKSSGESILGGSTSTTEPTTEPTTKPTTKSLSTEELVNMVLDRAIMAEAAMVAVTEMGNTELVESESFISALKSGIQTVGPAVLKIATPVLKTVGPIVLDLMAQKVGAKLGGS